MRDDREDLSKDLLELLGEDGFFVLVEKYGGLRLSIPGTVNNTALVGEIGMEYAALLVKRYGPASIRTPVAREFRIARYHRDGATTRQIASRFCVSERTIEVAVARIRKRSPGTLPYRQRKLPTMPPKPLVREKPKPKENERSLAIKAFFIEHAGTAFTSREKLERFNELHRGRFKLTMDAANHWCRWAQLEKSRLKNQG